MKRLGFGARAGAAAWVLGSCAMLASADGFDASRFHAVTSETGAFTQDGAGTLPRRRLDLGASVDIAHKALVARERATGDKLTMVGNRVTTHLTAGFGVTGRLELGLELPLILSQSGEFDIAGEELKSAAPGDVRLIAKFAFWQRGPWALAARLALALPTGSEAGLSGGGGSVSPEAIVGWNAGRASATGAIGYVARGAGQLEELVVDDELTLGAAFAFEARPRLSALAEATLAIGVQGDGRIGERPAEAILGARYALASGLRFQAGIGVGLGEGYGTPDVRGVFALGWGRELGRRDRAPSQVVVVSGGAGAGTGSGSGTGLGTTEPVVVADGDGDGVADADDRCPGVVGTAADGGCAPVVVVPAADGDGDGVLDAADRCPAEPEDKDGSNDGDGCPDLDDDGDGIPDTVDACPTVAEVMNGNEDEDGCADAGAALVLIEQDRIVLTEKLKFAAKKASLDEVSFRVLTTLGKVLLFHPELQKVEIRVSVARGNKLVSTALAEQRAESVRRYLIDNLGVEEQRLVGVGSSSDKPDGDGTEKVEIFVVKRE